MQNKFCSIPWIHTASTTSGASRVCCLMSNHSSGGLTGHNFKHNSIQEIHNSDFSKKIRKQFLAGEQPEECNTCWIKEQASGKSRRTFTNKTYAHLIDYNTAQNITDSDGSVDMMPVYWDLRFGNLCNLKCVMCGPQSSNAWYKDWSRVYDTDEFLDSGQTIKFNNADSVYDWHESDNFWQQLESNIDNLQHVYLVGGEPTLIEKHYNFLQKLVDADVAQHITLEYDTNITNVHQRAIDQWKHFKKLMLRVSVDDYGEQNNYIRFPSKWSKIEQNIEKIQSKLDNTEIEISITWQILNAFTFTKLLDVFKDYYINIRILSQPDFMDPKNLSPYAKQKLINTYNEIDDKRLQPLVSYLEEYIDYENFEKNMYFQEFLSKLDNYRNTDWQQTFTELQKAINT